MTDIVDVIRAVSELVERVFGAPPITKDITEGFDLPCTYVQPTLMQTSLEGGLRHDSYSIEIIRFGPRTRDGWLGLLEAQASLAETLENPIPISSTFFLYPEEVDFDLRRNEMTLITSRNWRPPPPTVPPGAFWRSSFRMTPRNGPTKPTPRWRRFPKRSSLRRTTKRCPGPFWLAPGR